MDQGDDDTRRSRDILSKKQKDGKGVEGTQAERGSHHCINIYILRDQPTTDLSDYVGMSRSS